MHSGFASKVATLDAMRASTERVCPEMHQTTWASECAIEFIQKQSDSDSPWLLNLNVYDPHPPFTPPKAYADRFDPSTMPGPHFRPSDLEQQAKLAELDFQDELRTPEEHDAHRVQALYYAMIAQIDDQLARILDALDATGQRDNTIVLFTSDHGEALGDHGLMYKGCRFYEGLVRVPLIFSWPSGSSSRVCTAMHWSNYSTFHQRLLEACGLECHDHMQGKSLLPILAWRRIALTNCVPLCGRSTLMPLDPHFTGGSGTFGTMFRTRNHKLCMYHDKQIGELYDLAADPWEFDNLWDSREHESVKNALIREAFDAHVVLTTDMGSRRIAPM